MREIGSEFSSAAIGEEGGFVLPSGVCDDAFSFCGRTAIETVLQNEPQIKKAMLPSYCCDSMLEPFRRSGIELCFYDVNYDHGLTVNLQIQEDVDAVLWCNYFGFAVAMPDLTNFTQHGGIIIEDITHSFLSKNKYHEQSHYLVASLRKWWPLLCGGYCAATKNTLKHKPTKIPAPEFLTAKKWAMDEKAAFLNGDSHICKDDFLKEFAYSNHWLAANYSALAMDELSVKILMGSNCAADYAARRNNAKVLYDGLHQIEGIHLLFGEEDLDCPLFVPVVIEKEKRELVRKALIENKIYCPTHWPRPDAECRSNLYDTELSLICDQRYNTKDMQRIIGTIRDCL